MLAYLGLGPASAAALIVALAIHHFLVRPLARNHHRLRKCSVLVTGADSGFGRTIALRLHALGATVYAGVLSVEEGAKLRAEVGGSERMRPVRCDVTSAAEVEQVVREIASGPPLWGLVNNAGIGAFGWCEALPLSSYRANTEVNYLGVVRLSRACLPLLRESRGRIVNMGSYGALSPSAFGSAYLSTKAAVRCFSACLEQEVFRFGVRVCYIEPGFFATRLVAGSCSAGGAESTAKIQGYPSFADKMATTAALIRLNEWMNGGVHGTEWVADAAIDALCSHIPLSRYTCGWDALLLKYAGFWLPDALFVWGQTAMDCGISGLLRVLAGGVAVP